MSDAMQKEINRTEYRDLEKITGHTIRDRSDSALQYYLDMIFQEPLIPHARFTFIDLFAGIGGMRIAFEEAGGQCVFSSEWDRFSQKTYYANFGVIPHGDITIIDEKEIPDHDVLVAGFPCQPFSIAGVSKKNSLGKNHGFLDQTQGTLFFDIVRIIKEKRPKAFLLENVKNLKNHDKGNTWKVISESLKELNYQISSAVINGKDWAPQNRERVFIIGFNNDCFPNKTYFNFEDLKRPAKKPIAADILESNVDDKYTLSDKLWNYLQNYAAKHKAKGNGFGFGLVDPNGTTRTLSARYHKDGSEILIPQKGSNPRRLTPREAARLQGFPEDFKIVVSDTQAYRQFGNAVVVPLVTELAKQLVEYLSDASEKRIKWSRN
jgi:DNA (cytosine-5)-methyltransferase 1